MNRRLRWLFPAVLILALAAFVLSREWDREDPPLLYEGPVQTLTSYHVEVSTSYEGPRDVSERLPWVMYGRPDETVRIWHDQRFGTVWRLGYAKPDLAGLEDIVTLRDGAAWSYDWATNTYGAPELDPARFAPSLIGPLPQRSIEEFLAGGDERSIIGEETVAGRRTLVLHSDPLGFAIDRYPSEVARVWIDPEFMFVLRYEFYDEENTLGELFRAEATKVEYNPSLDQGDFEFKLPADALPKSDIPLDALDRSKLPGLGKGDKRLPAIYLERDYTPQGNRYEDTSGFETGVQTWMGRETSVEILIMQRWRAGGLPKQLQAGRRVDVNGQAGYITSEGAITRVVWASGDIIVLVTSAVEKEDELLRIARSMH